MTSMSISHTALIIDDDKEMRQSLVHLLKSAGWKIEQAASAAGIEKIIDTVMPDVILTDVKMPGRSGIELLDDLAQDISPPVVLISAHGDIPTAVNAIQKGAYSFLEKPFDPRKLLTVLEHAASQHQLQKKTTRLKARLADLSGLNRVFIGQSSTVNKVREQVLDYSELQTPVLLIGETGTGKEVVAKALHDLSAKAEHSFVAINCAAIPVSEFEEITFGRKGKIKGLLSKANMGTLFLDEIVSAPLEIQAKLLRVLETKEITPLGSDTIENVDVRIITASSEDPETAVRNGNLRKDLFFRLNHLTITLPSLREHKDDIPLLFEHFVSEFARLYEVKPFEQSAKDISALLTHIWPGNVRELRSVAERSVLAARRGHGSAAAALHGSDLDDSSPENLRGAVASFERTLITKAIKTHGGKMDVIADALGIGRRTLNEKIVKLGLDKDQIL